LIVAAILPIAATIPAAIAALILRQNRRCKQRGHYDCDPRSSGHVFFSF
jgi:hypothetical protein